jgi:hypothetical protein
MSQERASVAEMTCLSLKSQHQRGGGDGGVSCSLWWGKAQPRWHLAVRRNRPTALPRGRNAGIGRLGSRQLRLMIREYGTGADIVGRSKSRTKFEGLWGCRRGVSLAWLVRRP